MTAQQVLKKSPVRLVLFDVFDTLVTPRLPVYEQYAQEANKHGISSVTPQSMKTAFKPAFKHMIQNHPLYGKHSNPPLSPEQWWTELITRSLAIAGAHEAELTANGPQVAKALLQRFENDAGYRCFPETISVLKAIRDLNVKVSIVSNADPRILLTLSSLGIEDLLSTPPTLSWDIEKGKPDPSIFHAACRRCDEVPGKGVIMVGDELDADFKGSVSAGLEGRLIRRPGEWSEGAIRTAEEDLGEINVVTDLNEIVDEVLRRNG